MHCSVSTDTCSLIVARTHCSWLSILNSTSHRRKKACRLKLREKVQRMANRAKMNKRRRPLQLLKQRNKMTRLLLNKKSSILKSKSKTSRRSRKKRRVKSRSTRKRKLSSKGTSSRHIGRLCLPLERLLSTLAGHRWLSSGTMFICFIRKTSLRRASWPTRLSLMLPNGQDSCTKT